jgi:hypothetical protein
MILNDGTLAVSEYSKTVDDIRAALERIIEVHYADNGSPDFEKLRISEEYRVLADGVRQLQLFDMQTLQTLNEARAFWINLYNTLTIHGIVHFQIKLTVWERPNFFIATEYNIGGYRFSLYDIAHGIIRGNRRRWRIVPPPFRGEDPRIRFALAEFDPRIHFALHAGSRSCPRVAVYRPDTLDADLEAAARRFLNGDQFIYDKQTRILSCSKIFKWYARDFGGTKAERLAYFARFIDDAETAEILREGSSGVTVKYLPYDWHLIASE